MAASSASTSPSPRPAAVAPVAAATVAVAAAMVAQVRGDFASDPTRLIWRRRLRLGRRLRQCASLVRSGSCPLTCPRLGLWRQRW
jgi:hypothetical protein